MKYNIITENNISTLLINNVPAACPFRSPFMVPGKFAGTADVIQPQCNSTCPHFRSGQFSGDVNKAQVIISCGSKEETFIIESEPKLKLT